MGDYKSVEEAAKYLGISGSAVRLAIKEGRLPAMRVGGVHIVPRKALKKYKVNSKMKVRGGLRSKAKKNKLYIYACTITRVGYTSGKLRKRDVR